MNTAANKAASVWRPGPCGSPPDSGIWMMRRDIAGHYRAKPSGREAATPCGPEGGPPLAIFARPSPDRSQRRQRMGAARRVIQGPIQAGSWVRRMYRTPRARTGRETPPTHRRLFLNHPGGIAVGSEDGSGFRLARARENIRETTRRTALGK